MVNIYIHIYIFLKYKLQTSNHFIEGFFFIILHENSTPSKHNFSIESYKNKSLNTLLVHVIRISI